MNIPAKLDKKSMKKDGKNFSSCENFLICDINTATASTICSRYYKGLSAHKDNLVIVITEQNRTEQNRTEQNRTEQNRTEHC